MDLYTCKYCGYDGDFTVENSTEIPPSLMTSKVWCWNCHKALHIISYDFRVPCGPSYNPTAHYTIHRTVYHFKGE